MTLFPERLKEERTRKGLSQEEFGKFFNLDKSTISLYESGKREPDYATLASFAEFFGCSTDYLLGKTNERRPADQVKEDIYTVAAHRTDDPMTDLPEPARKSLEEFIEAMKKKYGGQ